MALTTLSNIIDVTVFQDIPAVNSPEKTAFFESGVIVRTPLLDSLASQAGKIAELPFWNDLDATSEVNYSDSSETAATPVAIAQGEQIARKAFVNKGWKSADLAGELAMGGTALERVKERVESYFTKQWQRRVIATSRGLLADNIASNSSDMVYTVAAESIAAQSAATRWARTAFTGATFTMGDAQENIKAMGVHSAVYNQMVDADDIAYVPDSAGTGEVPTFLGRRVIVDDGLPVIAGTTDGLKYVSILFGEGMFGYGEGMAEVPVEIDRGAAEGNGGGTEALWVRKTWLLHPFGYQATGTPAAESFTLAELALAASFSRVIPRKNVPLAFLITN